MRILIFSSLSVLDSVGGAERSTHITAVALRELGHDVSLLSFSRTTQCGLHIVDGIRVHVFRLPNVYWPFNQERRPAYLRVLFNLIDICNPVALFYALRISREEKPNVIWTNMFKGWSVAVWPLFRLLGLPVVTTLREFDALYGGMSLMLNPESPKKIHGLWQVKCLMSVFPNVAVGISRDILRRYCNEGYFWGPCRKAVIGNPLLPRSVPVRESRPGMARLRVGWIGRFSGEKGIEIFLKASAHFFGDLSYEFLVAGGGDSKLVGKVVAAAEAGHLHYIGYCSPEAFYPNVDVVVVTSLWPEPFGRVVIEAFQYGCFVVSTDRGGLPEVNADRDLGAVYDGTAEELIEVLRGVDVRRIQANSDKFRHEAEKYMPTLIAQQYLQIFMKECQDATASVV